MNRKEKQDTARFFFKPGFTIRPSTSRKRKVTPLTMTSLQRSADLKQEEEVMAETMRSFRRNRIDANYFTPLRSAVKTTKDWTIRKNGPETLKSFEKINADGLKSKSLIYQIGRYASTFRRKVKIVNSREMSLTRIFLF